MEWLQRERASDYFTWAFWTPYFTLLLHKTVMDTRMVSLVHSII
jgi:hypothetical protein